jgi:hypothetical protein
MAACRWVLDQGVSAGGIAIAGDSAGGGLSVATLLALRDAGLPLPAAGLCISPWVVLDQMIHVWHWFLPRLDEAEQAVAAIGQFARERMTR